MHAALRRALTLGLVLMLGACYRAHEREGDALDGTVALDASSANGDALPDAVSWDAGPPDAARWDGGPCRYPHTLGAVPCTPDLQDECRRIAAWLGGAPYGRATCIQIGDGIHEQFEAFCSLGDDCRYDAGIQCRCAIDQYCQLDREVCVSNTADGPAYCARICSHP